MLFGVVIGWDMLVVLVFGDVLGVLLFVMVELLFVIEVVMVVKFNE